MMQLYLQQRGHVIIGAGDLQQLIYVFVIILFWAWPRPLSFKILLLDCLALNFDKLVHYLNKQL